MGVARALITPWPPSDVTPASFPLIAAPSSPCSYLHRSKLLLDQLLELTPAEGLRLLPLPGISIVAVHHVSDGFDQPGHVGRMLPVLMRRKAWGHGKVTLSAGKPLPSLPKTQNSK